MVRAVGAALAFVVGVGGLASAAADEASPSAPVIRLIPGAAEMVGPTEDAPRTGSAPVVPPAGDLTQGITVTRPPGPLVVLGAPAAVELERTTDGTYAGTVQGMRVADARSAETGWALEVRVPGLDAEVSAVVVEGFAESVEGMYATVGAGAVDGAPAIPVWAEPEAGAGAWDVTLHLEVEVPGAGAPTVTVPLDVWAG